MLNSMMKNGEIVPARITIGLLLKAMHKDEKLNFLVDGFPRNHENNQEWKRMVRLLALRVVLTFQDCRPSERQVYAVA
jgi:UMP-CMP kinase